MYKFRSVGQSDLIQPLPPATNPYCENLLPNMCVKEQRVLDKAKQDCWDREQRSQTRGLFGSLGRTCTLYDSDARVGMSQYNLWDPCMLARLPLCGAPTPPPSTDIPTTVTTTTPPQPETPDIVEDDDSDSGQFMVGGILGLLVLGGIGYAVFKNRKKKKGKRR